MISKDLTDYPPSLKSFGGQRKSVRANLKRYPTRRAYYER